MVVGPRSPVLGHQSSVVGCRLSVVGRRSLVVGRRSTVVIGRPSHFRVSVEGRLSVGKPAGASMGCFREHFEAPRGWKMEPGPVVILSFPGLSGRRPGLSQNKRAEARGITKREHS